MDIAFLLRGIAVGFSIAAPIGPIGVLCIHRTLAAGRATGFVSGLGAATADAFYGSIAAFGLAYVSNVLIRQQGWFHIAGGMFLCCLGAAIFLRTPAEQTVTLTRRGLAGAYVSTFFLTLANPMTIISYTAIFAGLGLANTGGEYAAAAALVAGVFIGSSLWWFILSSGVCMFRSKCTPASLRWVRKISGAIITGFGICALAGVL